eukprot:sb/3462335/
MNMAVPPSHQQINGSADSTTPLYYSSVEILAMGSFTILAVLGTVLNTLVIGAFAKFKLYLQPSNLQLLSLAMDDLGTAVLVEPFVVLTYLKPHLFVVLRTDTLIKSCQNVDKGWGSTISILILSSNRALIIIFPLIYRSSVTCKHIFYTLVGKYIFLVAFVTFSNFFWVSNFSHHHSQCLVTYVWGGALSTDDGFTETLTDKMTLPVLHLIAGAVIFAVNAVVVVQLVKIKLRKIVKGGGSKHVVSAGVELIILVAVYMVTTISIPVLFVMELLQVKISSDGIEVAAYIAKMLFYMQPIINPLIYVIRRTEYRNNMRRAMTSLHKNNHRGRHGDVRGPGDAGRFYRTARVVINTNRFINQVRISQRRHRMMAGGMEMYTPRRLPAIGHPIRNTPCNAPFAKFKLYLQPSNLQLLSLAMDDLGTAVLVEPFVVLTYLKPHLFVQNAWLCDYFSTVLHLFPWGSTISILILSSNRALIIIFPLIYRSSVTCKHIFYTLVGKYIFLVAFVTFSNFFWVSNFSHHHSQCLVTYVWGGALSTDDGFTETLTDKMTLPVLHLIAGAVIFAVNAVVVVQLVKIKLRKIVKGGGSKHVVSAGVELIILVAVYMVTTISIPVLFVMELLQVKISSDGIEVAAYIAKMLFYMQPIINPLIYVIRRTEYRNNMRRAMTSLHKNNHRGRHGDVRGPGDAGRFYRTARVVINTNRFINQVRISQRRHRMMAGGMEMYTPRRLPAIGHPIRNTPCNARQAGCLEVVAVPNRRTKSV